MALTPDPKHPGGRPTKYEPRFVNQVYKLCLLNNAVTDKEIADFFGVQVSTLNLWKVEYPEFLESLKRGKEVADGEVVNKLWQRATGYSCPEDKIFVHDGKPIIVPTIKHHPPDTMAAMYWLNNRQRANWKQRQEIDVNANLVLFKGEDSLPD